MDKSQFPKLKKIIVENIKKNQPADKANLLIEKIELMGEEEFYNFLKEQGLIKDSNECILCSIMNKEIPSVVIWEDSSAIAVLEINPVSKGHTLIIPKKHKKNENLEEELKNFIEEVKKKLIVLKTKNISIKTSELMGHSYLELIPEDNKFEKIQTKSIEELQNIKKEIDNFKKIEPIKTIEKINPNIKIPKRMIP